MLGFKQGDPYATFLKVVDEASGAFIAAAKWNIYKGIVPPEVDVDGDYWESAEEKEFAQSLFRGYLMPRRRAIRETGGALVCKCLRAPWRFSSLTLTAGSTRHFSRGPQVAK
jgi:hypothetical protein